MDHLLVDEGLELLEEDECRRLAATVPVGRIAVSLSAMPAVFPVNHRVVDGAIYFFSGEGVKLRTALEGAVVAFEADDFDPVLRTGWSVLTVGMAEEATVEDLDVGDRPVPWVPGSRARLIRITPTFWSGRRVRRPRDAERHGDDDGPVGC